MVGSNARLRASDFEIGLHALGIALCNRFWRSVELFAMPASRRYAGFDENLRFAPLWRALERSWLAFVVGLPWNAVWMVDFAKHARGLISLNRIVSPA